MPRLTEGFPDIWEFERQGVITHGERRLLEWQYRLQGDFRKALWEAIARADNVNLEKLRQGFPEDVLAFEMYTLVSGYWDELQQRVGLKDGPRTNAAAGDEKGS